MQIKKAEKYREGMMQLLSAAKLPVEDLPLLPDNFFVALNNKKGIIGVAGLEIYGDYGLLRSLAVSPAYRNQGVAAHLLHSVENLAALHKLKAIYLLTETASTYFNKKAYQTITRDEIPGPVRVSSEFSQVCPVSAIVMIKELI